MRRTPLSLMVALGIAVAGALLASACGDDDPSDTSTPGSVEGVGVVPPTLAGGGGASSARVPFDGVPAEVNGSHDVESGVAGAVDGNRVIVIGDSLMESTMVRYGASMCNSLVPRGWAVEIVAEVGQHVDYGIEVLDSQYDPDWDVAVVMLGNNYGGNQTAYEEQLDQIVQRLSPRPTVMFTVTEFESEQASVNESIWRVADRHDNVMMIDWNAETTADPSLLAGDGLHLSDDGKNRLAGLIGERLGAAPEGSVGDCLDDDYFDDSISSIPGAVTIPPATTTTVTPPSTAPAASTEPVVLGTGASVPATTVPTASPTTSPTTSPAPTTSAEPLSSANQMSATESPGTTVPPTSAVQPTVPVYVPSQS